MLKINRFAYLPDRTVGRATIGGLMFWTIEKPWLDNKPMVSCIPEGDYYMRKVDSPKFGPGKWEISGVENRTHILIHTANWAKDVLGCIGLGRGLFANLDGVSNSASAVDEFYEMTRDLEAMTVQVTSGAISAS